MKWQSEAILIRKIPFNDKAFIITVFTYDKGIQKGIIEISKANKNLLHEGNILLIEWTGRLENNLGRIKIIEYNNIYPFIFENNFKLLSILSGCSLINDLLLENDPHIELFNAFKQYLLEIKADEPFHSHKYIKFELHLLSELGYGLTLDRCAVTNQAMDLKYISPKTGKAVSEAEGKKYDAKLFKMPQSFYIKTNNLHDQQYSLKILRYFIEKHLYSIKNSQISYYRTKLEDQIIA